MSASLQRKVVSEQRKRNPGTRENSKAGNHRPKTGAGKESSAYKSRVGSSKLKVKEEEFRLV